MLFLFNKKILLVIFLLVLPYTSWGIIIVDIDPTDCGGSDKGAPVKFTTEASAAQDWTSPQQVRVVKFDVDTREFKSIFYYMTPENDISYEVPIDHLKLTYERKNHGNVSINATPLKSYTDDVWYIVSGTITNSFDGLEVIPFIDVNGRDRWLLRKKGAFFLPAADLYKSFDDAKNNRKAGDPLECTFLSTDFSEQYVMSGNHSLRITVGNGPHNKEMGLLGEIATKLLFFAHGYIQKPSKLSADTGFDGVFVDHLTTPTTMWIAETRFRSKAQSTKEMKGAIDNKFSPGATFEKYAESPDGTHKALGELITHFKETLRTGLFMVGICILPDGGLRASYLETGVNYFSASTVPASAVKATEESASSVTAAASGVGSAAAMTSTAHTSSSTDVASTAAPPPSAGLKADESSTFSSAAAYTVGSEKDPVLAIITRLRSSNKKDKVEGLIQLLANLGITSEDITREDWKNVAKALPFTQEEAIKKESRVLAEKSGVVGPRSIEGWELADVEDHGNCFYDAIVLQMNKLSHPFLTGVPDGTLSRDSLRLCIQGDEFKDEEWAEDEQIDKFVRKFDVVLAIVDTRNPGAGFVYYYLDEDGSVTTHVPDSGSPLPDKLVLRIAATGNHFLSVTSYPV